MGKEITTVFNVDDKKKKEITTIAIYINYNNCKFVYVLEEENIIPLIYSWVWYIRDNKYKYTPYLAVYFCLSLSIKISKKKNEDQSLGPISFFYVNFEYMIVNCDAFLNPIKKNYFELFSSSLGG